MMQFDIESSVTLDIVKGKSFMRLGGNQSEASRLREGPTGRNC